MEKDLKALGSRASQLGKEIPLIDSVLDSNESHKDWIISQAEDEGKSIGVAGIAYKKGTEITTRSPSLDIMKRLEDKGHRVIGFDPNVSTSNGYRDAANLDELNQKSTFTVIMNRYSHDLENHTMDLFNLGDY